MIKGLLPSGKAKCPDRNLIQCETNDNCVEISLICDGVTNCDDNSDEERSLCDVGVESFCCSLGEGRVLREGLEEGILTPGEFS